MGIHAIKMPDIGEGIAEVEIAEWRVKVGDVVAEDQPLLDVMTDKATVEIPSPVAGKVVWVGGNAGHVMAVGAEVIRLEVEGKGNVKEGASAPAPVAAAPKLDAPAATLKAAAPAAPPVVVEKSAPAAAPVEKRAPAPVTAFRKAGEKPIASPAVRRRAWEAGIELQYVHGSGPAGRIVQADLDSYAGSREAPAGRGAQYAQRHDEVAVPVIGLRRKIAQKMQESKRHIPHFTYVEEVDVTEVEALRADLNKRFAADRGKLTLLPFLVRAMVVALKDFPQINARYDDEADVVTRYGAVHLGVATQTDGGLMVPVLRHAESRDLWDTAAEIARIAEAARTGKARREELSGSTITLTSLGALGGIVSTPVINYPEVGIVGINRMVERPVIRGGAVVARQMMNLSSSFDHRVVDGMDAAEFIQVMKGLLERPANLFIE